MSEEIGNYGEITNRETTGLMVKKLWRDGNWEMIVPVIEPNLNIRATRDDALIKYVREGESAERVACFSAGRRVFIYRGRVEYVMPTGPKSIDDPAQVKKLCESVDWADLTNLLS